MSINVFLRRMLGNSSHNTNKKKERQNNLDGNDRKLILNISTRKKEIKKR